MRERLPDFEYHSPRSLDEASGLLEKYESSVLLQGGTDLVVAIKLKGFRPSHVVSLKLLRNALTYVRLDGGFLRIGSMTTISHLNESLTAIGGFDVLLDGTSTIGGYQIRNAATLGGNLCNASPAADSAPPLLVLKASLRVRGSAGERAIPIERFFVGPGKTVLQRGEILQEVVVPRPASKSGGAFVKLGRREGEDIAVASAAAYLEFGAGEVVNARIALGSVAPVPMRAPRAEDLLRGKLSDSKIEAAAEAASKECQPISDIRAGSTYRRDAVRVLTRSAIEKALQRSAGGASS